MKYPIHWVVDSSKNGHFYEVINNRDKKVLKAFGNHLRSLRREKGLSQEALTDEAGLSKNLIGMIERGEVNPTLISIEALAKGLGISKRKLMDYE